MIRRPPRSTLFPYTTALPISLEASLVPISFEGEPQGIVVNRYVLQKETNRQVVTYWYQRSEEHTSELQSRQYLVCRLLLEKKKKKYIMNNTTIILDSKQSKHM